jgi:hypothetical protein
MSVSATAVADPVLHNRWVVYAPHEKCYLNLAGSYDYLEMPYYISQDLEDEGKPIHPTCKEMLDAYVPPLFLHRARLAGLPVPGYYVSNGYFEPPVIIDPVNPFMIKSRVVLKPGRVNGVAKSMTRNFTYAICCQELPPQSRIARFRLVLDWSTSPRCRALARAVWETFHVPLATVRVIVQTDGTILLSDLSQLPFSALRPRERAYLEGRVQWDV